MSWIVFGEAQTSAFKIATLVSDDETGNSWPRAASTYTNTISQPNLAPAITCGRGDQDSCLMVYRSFATSDSAQIRTASLPGCDRAAQAGYGDRRRHHHRLRLARSASKRMDGGQRRSTGGYIQTLRLAHHRRSKIDLPVYDSDGPDTANFVYPRHTLDNSTLRPLALRLRRRIQLPDRAPALRLEVAVAPAAPLHESGAHGVDHHQQEQGADDDPVAPRPEGDRRRPRQTHPRPSRTVFRRPPLGPPESNPASSPTALEADMNWNIERAGIVGVCLAASLAGCARGPTLPSAAGSATPERRRRRRWRRRRCW